MDRDWLLSFERALLGRQCEIVRREFDWAANLVGGGSISLPVPWRIVVNGSIAFADKDDGQKFGLPAPVDAGAKANQLLGGRPISEVFIDKQTADLTVHFGNGVRLDAFNDSAGYEGWAINVPLEGGGLSVIAIGGGGVSTF